MASYNAYIKILASGKEAFSIELQEIEFFCNVMKSYDQSHDGSNQIGTISDYY